MQCFMIFLLVCFQAFSSTLCNQWQIQSSRIHVFGLATALEPWSVVTHVFSADIQYSLEYCTHEYCTHLLFVHAVCAGCPTSHKANAMWWLLLSTQLTCISRYECFQKSSVYISRHNASVSSVIGCSSRLEIQDLTLGASALASLLLVLWTTAASFTCMSNFHICLQNPHWSASIP